MGSWWVGGWVGEIRTRTAGLGDVGGWVGGDTYQDSKVDSITNRESALLGVAAEEGDVFLAGGQGLGVHGLKGCVGGWVGGLRRLRRRRRLE